MSALSNFAGARPPARREESGCPSCGRALPEAEDGWEPAPELAETWAAVVAELLADLPDYKFHIWIRPLALVHREGSLLVVRAPAHSRTWVRERYSAKIAAAAGRALESAVAVEVVGEGWRPAPPARPSRSDNPTKESEAR